MKKPLIILAGPTAIGKTALSIKLAKAINGEIISADSMQVYRGMDIGTAKITEEEKEGIEHYLIDVLDPATDFNVVSFQMMAKEAMDKIWAKGKIPIITGGTGFYIQSVLYDIDFTEGEELTAYRDELTILAKEKGNEYVHSLLAEVDYKASCEIHANNLKRVIRALEFYKQTGLKISQHNELEKQKESPYDFCYFVLNDDRELIYDRINKRVDIMIENGLVDEVKALRDKGLSRNLVSMQGLGYKEIFMYLEGELSLDAAIDLIKKGTRHFAKKQLTWFKRERDVIFINKSDDLTMLNQIIDIIKNKGVME